MPRNSMAHLTEVLPYKSFGIYFEDLIYAWQKRNGVRFVNANVEAEMDIHSTSISKFRRGRNRPTMEQCLPIARFFDRPIEEVLHEAGYPNLDDLRQIIENDQTPHDPDIKKRVLDILRIAEKASLWQNLSCHNPYKDHADRILASDIDNYQKALDYTDIVYFWYQSRERDMPRALRKTDDMLPITL